MPIGEIHRACPHLSNRVPRDDLPDVKDGLTHWERHAEYFGAADRGEATVNDTCPVLTRRTLPKEQVLTGLPTIPPPCYLRQFPFVFVLGFMLGVFLWQLCHRDDLARFAVLAMKARPPFHLRDRVRNETIACILL